MKYLLLESQRQQSELWQQKLSQISLAGADGPFSGTECHSVEDLESTLETQTFSIAFCSLDLLSESPANKLKSWKSRVEVWVGLSDEDAESSHARAIEMGLDDFLPSTCTELEIKAVCRIAHRFETLNELLAQAQKLESIGELAAGIAHEINTPIQYVGDNTRFVRDAWTDIAEVLIASQAFVETSKSGSDTTLALQYLEQTIQNADADYLLEEVPSAVQQTLEGIDRVTNIVRAMKEFAHPGNSEMTLIDLGKAIENTAMVARNEWKYVAELVTELAPNMPLVPCLPGEINQVLLNMIVNASHAIAEAFGETSELQGRITVSTSVESGFAEIRIADNGKGIAPQHLDKIFNPFFTTKAAGKGTGQGLAIARTVVVEKHSGKIEVESEVGVGTTFIIRLPLEQTTDAVELEHELANAAS